MRTAQRVLGLALLAAVGFAPAARAQAAATGNIYGTVRDESGAVLPGATATLTGNRAALAASGCSRLARRCSRRQRKSTLALMPFSSAIPETDAPGCRQR